MTDKREEPGDSWQMSVEHSWYAPACSSRVCRALPYMMEASITDARAYEATTLSVDVAELYSCRSDCHLMSFGEGRLWTCRYCHMSSDRLVAQQIKRQEVSRHVSTVAIGRCDEASPQCQNPIESEQEGLKSDGR